MIGLEERQALARDIETAHAAGARLRLACETAGIELRTLQRWQAHEGLTEGDGRPTKGFVDLEAARAWAQDFVHWYNHDHRHSGIRYVSPVQRHDGEDQAILAAHHEL